MTVAARLIMPETSPSSLMLARTSLVIPAFNEEATIERVLASTPPEVGEIIVVDGVSTDRTAAIARGFSPRVSVISRTRRGKGNALACGFAVAGGDYVVAMDSDGSADPHDISSLVAPLDDGFADFVKGYRTRQEHLPGREAARALGTGALTKAFNARLGQKFSDVCCGFIAFRRELEAAFELDWRTRDTKPQRNDGFEIDTALLGRAILSRARVVERPVHYLVRQGGYSKTRMIPDGLRVVRAISELR